MRLCELSEILQVPVGTGLEQSANGHSKIGCNVLQYSREQNIRIDCNVLVLLRHLFNWNIIFSRVFSSQDTSLDNSRISSYIRILSKRIKCGYDLENTFHKNLLYPSVRNPSVRPSVRYSSVLPYPRFVLTPPAVLS